MNKTSHLRPNPVPEGKKAASKPGVKTLPEPQIIETDLPVEAVRNSVLYETIDNIATVRDAVFLPLVSLGDDLRPGALTGCRTWTDVVDRLVEQRGSKLKGWRALCKENLCVSVSYFTRTLRKLGVAQDALQNITSYLPAQAEAVSLFDWDQKMCELLVFVKTQMLKNMGLWEAGDRFTTSLGEQLRMVQTDKTVVHKAYFIDYLMELGVTEEQSEDLYTALAPYPEIPMMPFSVLYWIDEWRADDRISAFSMPLVREGMQFLQKTTAMKSHEQDARDHRNVILKEHNDRMAQPVLTGNDLTKHLKRKYKNLIRAWRNCFHTDQLTIPRSTILKGCSNEGLKVSWASSWAFWGSKFRPSIVGAENMNPLVTASKYGYLTQASLSRQVQKGIDDGTIVPKTNNKRMRVETVNTLYSDVDKVLSSSAVSFYNTESSDGEGPPAHRNGTQRIFTISLNLFAKQEILRMVYFFQNLGSNPIDTLRKLFPVIGASRLHGPQDSHGDKDAHILKAEWIKRLETIKMKKQLAAEIFDYLSSSDERQTIEAHKDIEFLMKIYRQIILPSYPTAGMTGGNHMSDIMSPHKGRRPGTGVTGGFPTENDTAAMISEPGRRTANPSEYTVARDTDQGSETLQKSKSQQSLSAEEDNVDGSVHHLNEKDHLGLIERDPDIQKGRSQSPIRRGDFLSLAQLYYHRNSKIIEILNDPQGKLTEQSIKYKRMGKLKRTYLEAEAYRRLGCHERNGPVNLQEALDIIFTNFGNPLRFLRLGMLAALESPQTSSEIGWIAFQKLMKKIHYHGSIRKLFTQLDRNRDGIVTLEDLHSETAIELLRLQEEMTDRFTQAKDCFHAYFSEVEGVQTYGVFTKDGKWTRDRTQEKMHVHFDDKDKNYVNEFRSKAGPYPFTGLPPPEWTESKKKRKLPDCVHPVITRGKWLNASKRILGVPEAQADNFFNLLSLSDVPIITREKPPEKVDIPPDPVLNESSPFFLAPPNRGSVLTDSRASDDPAFEPEQAVQDKSDVISEHSQSRATVESDDESAQQQQGLSDNSSFDVPIYRRGTNVSENMMPQRRVSSRGVSNWGRSTGIRRMSFGWGTCVDFIESFGTSTEEEEESESENRKSSSSSSDDIACRNTVGTEGGEEAERVSVEIRIPEPLTESINGDNNLATSVLRERMSSQKASPKSKQLPDVLHVKSFDVPVSELAKSRVEAVICYDDINWLFTQAGRKKKLSQMGARQGSGGGNVSMKAGGTGQGGPVVSGYLSTFLGIMSRGRTKSQGWREVGDIAATGIIMWSDFVLALQVHDIEKKIVHPNQAWMSIMSRFTKDKGGQKVEHNYLTYAHVDLKVMKALNLFRNVMLSKFPSVAAGIASRWAIDEVIRAQPQPHQNVTQATRKAYKQQWEDQLMNLGYYGDPGILGLWVAERLEGSTILRPWSLVVLDNWDEELCFDDLPSTPIPDYFQEKQKKQLERAHLGEGVEEEKLLNNREAIFLREVLMQDLNYGG